MPRFIVRFLVLLSLGACQGKEQLGTELANASMSPVLWEPLDSSSAIDPNGPPPTTCALRLRDLRTGTEYQILRRQATRTNRDRKSTRLNSSHLVISYAVFCLK